MPPRSRRKADLGTGSDGTLTASPPESIELGAVPTSATPTHDRWLLPTDGPLRPVTKCSLRFADRRGGEVSYRRPSPRVRDRRRARDRGRLMTEDDIGFGTGHGGLTARSPDQDSKNPLPLRDVTTAPALPAARTALPPPAARPRGAAAARGLRAARAARRPHAARPLVPLVRVLLCEDEEVFRLGLRVVIEAQPDIAVVAETSQLGEALEVADGPGAQVVVIRQGLVGCSGLPLLRELCQRATGVLVLAETGSELGLLEVL